VTSQFTQSTSFKEDPSGSIDTPIWQLNQGMLQYWHKLNNNASWISFIQILYSVVNQGLGTFTNNWMAQAYVGQTYATNTSDVNLYFFNNTVTSMDTLLYVQDMLTDPQYWTWLTCFFEPLGW